MKRTFITLIILIILGLLGYSSYLAHEIYGKYNETISWENSSLLSNIHQVPPILAQNYISTNEQELLQILTDINASLEEIKRDGEIKDDKLNDYLDLHEKAKVVIGDNNSHETFNDFSLYLKVDLAIKGAYEELNIETLDEYAETLANRLSKEDNKIERSLLNKLYKISSDYKMLNEFSKNALSKLGVIEGNVLYIDIKVNRQITDELLKEIDDKKLTRFIHIKNLAEVLSGDSWEEILAHNASSLEYYSWKDSEKILNALVHSNYVLVSSFNTVEDVLAYKPLIQLEQKENHTIDEASLVTSVHYNGQPLDENLYVKRGADLNFVIEYEYIEDPKSTIIVEYVDVNGVKLGSDESYTGYVNNDLDVTVKDFEGYNFVKIDNDLNKFPDDDSTIKVIYEEFIPEPEVEEEENEVGEDIDEESEEDKDIDEESEDEENKEDKDSDKEENKSERENVNI